MMSLLNLKRYFVFLLCGLAISSTSLRADDSVLDDIKSVYIYNFLSFISWPEDKLLPIDRYQLCVVGNPSLKSKLESVVRNELVNNLPIHVASAESSVALNECHIIYIDRHELLSKSELADLKSNGSLLVADYSGFISSDLGMVGFETRGRKVRVAMKLSTLQDEGFKVSSKLLRVVRIEK